MTRKPSVVMCERPESVLKHSHDGELCIYGSEFVTQKANDFTKLYHLLSQKASNPQAPEPMCGKALIQSSCALLVSVGSFLSRTHQAVCFIQSAMVLLQTSDELISEGLRTKPKTAALYLPCKAI